MISTNAHIGAVTVTDTRTTSPELELNKMARMATEPPTKVVSRASGNEPIADRPPCRCSGNPNTTKAVPHPTPRIAAGKMSAAAL